MAVIVPATAIDATDCSNTDSGGNVNWTFDPETCIGPITPITPGGGIFVFPVEVTFNCPTGSRVLYSIDGSEPDIIWDGIPVLLTGGTKLVRMVCQNDDCSINIEANATFVVGSLAEDPILLIDGYGYGYGYGYEYC